MENTLLLTARAKVEKCLLDLQNCDAENDAAYDRANLNFMKSVQEMNNVVASSNSKRKSSGVEDKNTKSTKTVFSDTPASSSSSSSATAVKLPIDVVNEKLTIVLEKHKCDGFMNVSESDEDDEEGKDSEEYEDDDLIEDFYEDEETKKNFASNAFQSQGGA